LNLSPESVNRAIDVAWTWTAAFLPRFVAALLILIVGSIIARWLSRAIFNVASRNAHVDATMRPILAAIVRYSILIRLQCRAELGWRTDRIALRRPRRRRYCHRLGLAGHA
jgi:hypothetical protein